MKKKQTYMERLAYTTAGQIGLKVEKYADVPAKTLGRAILKDHSGEIANKVKSFSLVTVAKIASHGRGVDHSSAQFRMIDVEPSVNWLDGNKNGFALVLAIAKRSLTAALMDYVRAEMNSSAQKHSEVKASMPATSGETPLFGGRRGIRNLDTVEGNTTEL